MLLQPRFLVVSLGNPSPHYNTLHSAGHHVLNGLTSTLRHSPFGREKMGDKKCLVSRGPKYTLVQSPTSMNISGKFVARAWKEMGQQHRPGPLGLVLVHDELELKFGQVALRSWDRSHKGHNGIRSVKASLPQSPSADSLFARIAVGIDRPPERDAETVARYVLSEMVPEQRRTLADQVPERVAEVLEQLEDEWK